VSSLASPLVNCRITVQVDHETLVEKLREVNEAQLKLVQPKLVKLLGARSQAALGRVEREAVRVQQSIDMLDAQRMPVKKRQYAFAKQRAAFADPVRSDSALSETASRTQSSAGTHAPTTVRQRTVRHTLGRGYSIYASSAAGSTRTLTPKQPSMDQIRQALGDFSFEEDECGAESSPSKAPQSLSSTAASLDLTLPSAVK